jgi:hypothetical protein
MAAVTIVLPPKEPVMKGLYALLCTVGLLSLPLFAQDPAGPYVPPEEPPSGNVLRSEPWTWHNLFYGPLEILASPLVLVMGPVYGVNSAMEKYADDTYGLPDSIPRRMLYGTAGSVVGLMMGPGLALKGVFDTLTGGYWADDYFRAKTGAPTPGRFTADPNKPPLREGP